MPTARESLLDAARSIVSARPWGGVRMGEVATVAGVSRQTLYNEFGSKHGLGVALVHREVDVFLSGVERALTEAVRRRPVHGRPEDTTEALATAADWALRAAAGSPLLQAALTGRRDVGLPGPPTEPAQVLRDLWERSVGVLRRAGAEEGGLEAACEAMVRLTLSYLIAPGESVESTRRGLREVSATVRWPAFAPTRGGGAGGTVPVPPPAGDRSGRGSGHISGHGTGHGTGHGSGDGDGSGEGSGNGAGNGNGERSPEDRQSPSRRSRVASSRRNE